MKQKNLEHVYGYYNFDSYRMINPLNNKEDIWEQSADIHELMHFLLSANSSYGMLLYALAKIKRSNDWNTFSKDTRNRHESMMCYLVESSRKVQEGFAIFYQWTYYRLRHSLQTANTFLDNLQSQNKTYFNYIQPILFIIEKLKTSSDEEVMQVGESFFNFCVDCLNIPIHELEANKLFSKGCYNKFSSHDGNASRLIPNVIFREKLAELKEITQTSNTPLHHLITSLIHTHTSEKTISDVTTDSLAIKSYVLKLFPKETDNQTIEALLCEIEPREISAEEIWFATLPINLDYTNAKPLTPKEADERIVSCKTPRLTVLLLNGISLKGHSATIQKMNNRISDFGKENAMIALFDLHERELYLSMIEKRIIETLLHCPEHPANMVVNYKDYDYNAETIISLGSYTHDLYIYCDRTFYNAKEYIKKFSNKPIHYTALHYYSLYIIVFRLNSRTCFFLPVVSSVYPLAIINIEKDYPQFINCTQSETIDGTVIRNAKEKREIDIMISNLYFIKADINDPYFATQLKHCIV